MPAGSPPAARTPKDPRLTTLLLTHKACLDHATPEGHPERADRLRAIAQILGHPPFDPLLREEAPEADPALATLVHPEAYVDEIVGLSPAEGRVPIDADTSMSPGTLRAALIGVGAACRAVDAVMAGEATNAFCATRPPGHHAETARAMGFCFFNNAAIAARHAQRAHGAERVAIVDFDVHHGNGTQDIFWSDPTVLYASTHQMPLYPGSGAVTETGVGNIVNAPLRAGDGGPAFREAMTARVLPALEAFSPDLVVISAGFDAHRDDPLGGLHLEERDFSWATAEMMAIAARTAKGRIVSVLEGGYDLMGLARSTAAHVLTLMKA